MEVGDTSFWYECVVHLYDVCIGKRKTSVGLVTFFFQAEDGIRDLVRSRGLGDVYKRQGISC